MNDRFAERLSPRQSVEQDLQDSGCESIADWRLGVETHLSQTAKVPQAVPIESYPELAQLIAANPKDTTRTVDEFVLASGRLEKLTVLSGLSISDQFRCLTLTDNSERALEYIETRLAHYNALGQRLQMGDLVEHGTNPNSAGGILTGLKRDILYAFMLGSPELAVLTLATRLAKRAKVDLTHFPKVRGFASGIDSQHEGIGQYAPVFELYQVAQEQINNSGVLRRSGAEHRAVRLAAKLLFESAKYNPAGRGPRSPYVGSINEATAWARLGGRVKRQFQGMRHRIQDARLHNIKRFIGKSGDNRYQAMARELRGEIRRVADHRNPAGQWRITQEQNKRELIIDNRKFEANLERLEARLEKGLKQIATQNLPEEESALQQNGARTRFEKEKEILFSKHRARTSYLTAREPNQLRLDLESRLSSIEPKVDSHKSLAQKALDLHFHFNHIDSPYGYTIDWINQVGFGQIKRAHRMLVEGVADGVILALSVENWKERLVDLLADWRSGGSSIAQARELIYGLKVTGICADPLSDSQVLLAASKATIGVFNHLGLTNAELYHIPSIGSILGTETKEQATKIANRMIQAGELERALAITSLLSIIGNPIDQDPDFQRELKHQIKFRLEDKERYTTGLLLLRQFELSSLDFKEEVDSLLLTKLGDGAPKDLANIIRATNLTPEKLFEISGFKRVLKFALENCVAHADLKRFGALTETLRLPSKLICEIEIGTEAVKAGMLEAFRAKKFEQAIELLRVFPQSDEVVREIFIQAAAEIIEANHDDAAVNSSQLKRLEAQLRFDPEAHDRITIEAIRRILIDQDPSEKIMRVLTMRPITQPHLLDELSTVPWLEERLSQLAAQDRLGSDSSNLFAALHLKREQLSAIGVKSMNVLLAGNFKTEYVISAPRKIREIFGVGDEELGSNCRIRQAAFQLGFKFAAAKQTAVANDIKLIFALPFDFSPENIEFRGGASSLLVASTFDSSAALQIARYRQTNQVLVDCVVIEALAYCIEKKLDRVKEIVELCHLPTEALNSLLFDEISQMLFEPGGVARIKALSEKIPQVFNLFVSEEAGKESAIPRLKTALARGLFNEAEELVSLFNIPKETLLSFRQEILAGYGVLVGQISAGITFSANLETLEIIRVQYNILDQELAQHEVIMRDGVRRVASFVLANRYQQAIELHRLLSLNQGAYEFLSADERQRVQFHLEALISEGIFDYAKPIIELKMLSAAQTATSIRAGCVGLFSRLRQSYFKQACEIFDLSQSNQAQIAFEAAARCAKSGDRSLLESISSRTGVSVQELEHKVAVEMEELLIRGEVYSAIEAQQRFQFPQTMMTNSPKLYAGLIKCVLSVLAEDDLDCVEALEKLYYVDHKAVISDPMVKRAIYSGLVGALRPDTNLDRFHTLAKFGEIKDEQINALVLEVITTLFYRNQSLSAVQIQQHFHLSADTLAVVEAFDSNLISAAIAMLNYGDLVGLQQLETHFYLVKDKVLREPNASQALHAGLVWSLLEVDDKGFHALCLWANVSTEQSSEAKIDAIRKAISPPTDGANFGHFVRNLEHFDVVLDRIDFSRDEILKGIGIGLFKHLVQGQNLDADGLLKRFNATIAEYEADLSMLPECFYRVALAFGISAVDKLVELMKKQREFFDFLIVTPDKAALLTPKSAFLAEKMHIKWAEAEQLLRGGVDIEKLHQERDFRGTYIALRAYSSNWNDSGVVVNPFEKGAEIFGFKTMLAYADRPGLTRHNAFFAFNGVLKIFEESGLSPNEFAQRILFQVRLDRAAYPEGTAHQHLNALVQNLSGKIKDSIEQAKQYQSIKRLSEYLSRFRTTEDVFSSWITLKRFGEFHDLLGRAQGLQALAAMRQSGNKDRVCEYIERLAFSDSRVSMVDAINFGTNPGLVFDKDETHSPETHRLKKPSHYVKIPHIGLSAENLRDALVEGSLDSLQGISPLEIKYRILHQGVKLTDLLKEALGSRSDQQPGKARNPGKLFSEVKRLLTANGSSIQKITDSADGEIPQNLKQDLLTLIGDSSFGMNLEHRTVTCIAKIFLKSDPEGVLVGNDTACCMPFGSGKNTVYTFNPNYAFFAVQVVNGHGKARTIAQSVLSKDKELKVPVPEIIARITSGVSMASVVPEDALREAPAYLACDNVEVAENFKRDIWPQIIEAIYRDFFGEYMNRFAAIEGLQPTLIPVGMNYSDTMTHLPKAQNTYVPLAPAGYSDKIGANVYLLDLTRPSAQTMFRDIRLSDRPRSPQVPIGVKGVRYLDFTGTLPVSYLEGKAYASNPSLIVYLHNIENGLIAKDIANQFHGRPNLSIQYIDPVGSLKGYMIAYEGKYSAKDGSADFGEGKRIIYVADIAAEPGSFLAGGKLLAAFAELYRKNYLDKGDPVPIYAELRDQTSYRLLKRKLDELARKVGREFELIEHETYHEGKDLMHPVTICLKQSTSIMNSNQSAQIVVD